MNTGLKALIAATSLGASTAWAIPYVEIGDAGESLVSAQAVGGGVDAIYGNVTSTSADLFSFNWGGGAFTVDTFGSTTDTQLFLFNAAGQGVWANDNASLVTLQSQIVDPTLAAGQYFIGISIFDYDPFSGIGAIFPSAPFNGQFGSLNSASLDHWAFFSPHQTLGGNYIVNFHTPTAVPEPPLLAMFGIALVALGIATQRRRRRRRNNSLFSKPSDS